MRKKVLACILLSILLINSLVTPIAYSLDNVVPNPDEVTQVEPKTSDDSSEEDTASGVSNLNLSSDESDNVDTKDDTEATNGEKEEEEKEQRENIEDKQTIEVAIPKINVYNSDDESDENHSASFSLRKESDEENLATWTTEEGEPTLELEVGTIYILEESGVEGFDDAEEIVKLRLTAEGDFEQEVDGNWVKIETIKIPINKTQKASKAARVSRAPVTDVVQPTTIGSDDVAPINKLQIIKNMPSTSRVSIVANGTGARYDTSVRVSGGNEDQDNNHLHGGNYNIGTYGIDPNIKEALGNDSRTALIVRFKPSSTNWWEYGSDASTSEGAGWNSEDLDLATSQMWVKVRYTDAAYYDDELVDAIATITVTPYKNRTLNVANGQSNYTYSEPFYPMIEISDLLYGGWTWQNVFRFHVDIQFVPRGADESQAIEFPDGNLDSMEAAYYTINSLDPLRTEGDWDNPNRAVYGPESVRPDDGTTSGAYIIPGSNIVTSYNDGPAWVGTQYAYNGGSNPWGTAANRKKEDDNPTYNGQPNPNWSKNSVLFTTAQTKHISVTLGNLARKPAYQNVSRTNYVWATISTDAFTQNKVTYIDIPIKKTWSDPNNSHEKVTVDLYAVWTENGQAKDTLIQSQDLSVSNNWNTVFRQVPDITTLGKLIRKNFSSIAQNIRYEVRERDVPPEYDSTITSSTVSGIPNYTVTNRKVRTGLTITKTWYQNNNIISNQNTSSLGPIKVTLKRRIGNQVDNNFNQVIELSYNSDANLSWKKTVDNLPMRSTNDFNATNNIYTYYIEEDLLTLPANFSLRGYRNSNSGTFYNNGSQAGIPLTIYSSQNNLGVSNTQTSAGLIITKSWFDNGQPISNQDTSDFGLIKVTLRRSGGTANENAFSQVIELNYNSDSSLSWKQTVNNLPLKSSNGANFTYYIEEDTSTLPDNFYIKGYRNSNTGSYQASGSTVGIVLKFNTQENNLEVANERKISTLTIRKRWYMQDGETEIANADLPKNLKVKLYQTTNGATSGGSLYKEITLTRQGSEGNYTWKTDEVVPIRDKTGQLFYTYYIVEDDLPDYLEISEASDTFVTFSGSMEQPSVELTLKNKVNPVYPSTGGFGSRPYMMIGIISLFMAVILYYMQKKKIFWRKEK